VEIKKAEVDQSKFNTKVKLPYGLRLADFQMAMQDIYDFLHRPVLVPGEHSVRHLIFPYLKFR